MASSVIHMAVANEINKKLKFDNSTLLIGTIAPDISKLIGEDKSKSHFLDKEEENIPNIDKFLEKYKSNLNDPFVMGYFIHLYTDYLWFKYFISDIYSTSMIKKINGDVVKCNDNMFCLYVYNDYTDLNTKLIDEYNLDLKILSNDIPYIKNIIDEIPLEKVNLIIKKTEEIILKSKERKNLIFDINNIKKFIELCVELIWSVIEELNINY